MFCRLLIIWRIIDLDAPLSTGGPWWKCLNILCVWRAGYGRVRWLALSGVERAPAPGYNLWSLTSGLRPARSTHGSRRHRPSPNCTRGDYTRIHASLLCDPVLCLQTRTKPNSYQIARSCFYTKR